MSFNKPPAASKHSSPSLSKSTTPQLQQVTEAVTRASVHNDNSAKSKLAKESVAANSNPTRLSIPTSVAKQLPTPQPIVANKSLLQNFSTFASQPQDDSPISPSTLSSSALKHHSASPANPKAMASDEAIDAA